MKSPILRLSRLHDIQQCTLWQPDSPAAKSFLGLSRFLSPAADYLETTVLWSVPCSALQSCQLIPTQARQDGRSTVRVSSTVFFHAHPDVVLQPLIEGPLAVAPIEAGTWLQQELKAIAMPVAKELQAH